MRAFVVEQPEGSFRQVNLPRPALLENQVLVRVQASGVNPLDAKIRAGKGTPCSAPPARGPWS